MTEFTTEQRVKLEDYLSSHTLPSGIGTEESACSIAAINLAISGELTDKIPDCMSKVLGKATIRLQDNMPDKMRNSARYKRLLPDMAGTGRAKEKERLAVLMDWVWSTALPQLQPLADEIGFGVEWSNMCRLKTREAARCAAEAADADANAADADAANAAKAAYAAAYAAAANAANAAAYAANAADADADAANAAAANAAAYAAAAAAAYNAAAAAAAYNAASAAGFNTFWNDVDPISVLERMTYLNGDKDE